jgi:hypothetical protein
MVFNCIFIALEKVQITVFGHALIGKGFEKKNQHMYLPSAIRFDFEFLAESKKTFKKIHSFRDIALLRTISVTSGFGVGKVCM